MGKPILKQSWERHKKDLLDMCFCNHPFETTIIDRNFSDWIDKLTTKLQNYTPSRCKIVNIPKKGFHLRPGAILTPEDATVFNALLLREIDKIRANLLWSAQKTRFSYILNEDQTKSNWFVNEYKGWTNFRKQSSRYIDQGYIWVVFADISGYFENISIKKLMEDLETFGLSENIRKLLCKCLYRWAEPRARGIPQGSSCSSILGEVYLNSLDKRLSNKNIKFCRYVDDIRIFCRSKEDAIMSLHLLTILLREKELNLQTTKSFIKNGKDAKSEIDGITAVIQDVEKNILEELAEFLGWEMMYPTPSSITEALSEIDEDIINLEAIRRTFAKYFEKKKDNFDKTLFHYCINRLGAANNDYAVKYCIDSLLDKPEEFKNMLSYFSKLSDKKTSIVDKIVDAFNNNNNNNGSMFDRHYFLLLQWIYNENIITDSVLTLSRNIAFSPEIDEYTKHYAWAILGANGNSVDLDAIEAQYNKVGGSELSKATIICSIKKMIKSRRNSIYQRAMGDGDLVKYSVVASKGI